MPGNLSAQNGSGEPTLSKVQYITSSQSRDNRNPKVAYSPDGSHLFAVWDGLINGNRRIILRERISGEWLEAVIVDNNPAGNNDFPSISIDSGGVPHVTWISMVEGKRRPYYARRVSRYPNAWHQQEIPFPKDSTVSGDCDFLKLQLDPSGQPWITWQYGFGSVSSIAVSRFNGAGDLVSAELTPGAVTLNLEPALFFSPDPTVYWYVAQSDQFFLVGSKYHSTTGEWQVSLPENLDNLPSDNLPDLFKTGDGPLAAVWYDRPAGDETVLPYDRVLIGLQNPETKGRGEVIDQRLNADYHSLVGLNEAGVFFCSWITESYTTGEQIVASVGTSPDNFRTFELSSNENNGAGYISPGIAVGINEASVIWEENRPGESQSQSQIVVRDILLP